MVGLREFIEAYGVDTEFKGWMIRELLQKLILYIIYTSQFGKYYVFQGGTAIRLFYGSPRFSLDLDFTIIQRDINELKQDARSIVRKLESYLVSDNINVEIQKEKISSDNLMFRYYVTFNTVELIGKKTRIKVESLLGNIIFEAREEILELEFPIKTAFGVRVKKPEQILCDKIAALAGGFHRAFIRWRDIFDIYWLKEKMNAEIDDLYLREEFGSWQENLEDLKGLITYLKEINSRIINDIKKSLCKLLPSSLCSSRLLKRYIKVSLVVLEDALGVLTS